MKILVASDVSGHSGVGDYVVMLAAALADLGHVEAEPPEVVIYNFTPYGAGVFLGWLRVVRSVRRLRRRAQWLVVVFHEVFVRPDDRFRMRLFEYCQRWTARRLDGLADATVVLDEARHLRLAALCPHARAPRIIPVGPNIPVPSTLRRAEEPVVVVFGLLHPDRDIETVVRAVTELHVELPDVRMRIIGDLDDDPTRKERLESLISELLAPVSVEGFLDADQVAAAMASARAYVTTYVGSVSLGSGTLATAFAYALPVVVYAEAELHEMLVPGQTVLVAEREPASLKHALKVALGETGMGIGAEGRRLYESELAWPRIAERFNRLLLELESGRDEQTMRR